MVRVGFRRYRGGCWTGTGRFPAGIPTGQTTGTVALSHILCRTCGVAASGLQPACSAGGEYFDLLIPTLRYCQDVNLGPLSNMAVQNYLYVKFSKTPVIKLSLFLKCDRQKCLTHCSIYIASLNSGHP